MCEIGALRRPLVYGFRNEGTRSRTLLMRVCGEDALLEALEVDVFLRICRENEVALKVFLRCFMFGVAIAIPFRLQSGNG